jgi:glucan phosphoethanolaminetransferase (alkaline phosphatase superfamily)
MRPASIVNFERLYLGALALGVANTILSWDQALASIRAQPNSAVLGPNFLLITAVAGVLIQLLLWYFIARRASVVAKWIFVVLFVIGLVAFVAGLARTGFPGGVEGILGVLTMLMQVAAVWMLFRPDANAWFSDGRGGPDPEVVR